MTPCKTADLRDRDGWLKAAISTAADEAYREWFSAKDPRLELNIAHAKELERVANSAQWVMDVSLGYANGLFIMLPIGRCRVMWSWPYEDSISILDAARDGRRVVVRKVAGDDARKENIRSMSMCSHNLDRGMPVYDFPCSCGRPIRGTDRDRGKRCTHEVACPGCGTPVVFTANDCLVHHYIGKTPCAWNGRQRAVVEHEHQRMREHPAEPKPPTLREWLGDRVSDLGPWAEVLREQPVPAGQIVGWEWYQTEIMPRLWMLRAKERAGAQVFGPSDTIDFLTRWEDFDGDCLRESLQMALFARHPAVKPEPRKPTLRTWFGNEEEP